MSTMAQTAVMGRKTLIIVDPGFSKFSMKIGQNLKAKLTERRMTVKLLTVRQFRPSDLEGVELLVLGGPTYVGQPSGGLKRLLTKLDKAAGTKTLFFITGGADCSGLGLFNDLAKAKGLKVIGNCGILSTEQAPEIEQKLDQLLGAI